MISDALGMKYTPSCKPVDLMLNGEYKGNFGLCEKVEVAKGRLDLKEDENSENQQSDGALIQASGIVEQGVTSLKTTKGINYFIEYPDSEDITSQQSQNIENFFNKIESEVYDGIINNIDLDSFAGYVLTQEFSGNPDVFYSTYMTKYNGDDKLYFGPVWDFDLGFGNDFRTYPIMNNEDLLLKCGPSAGTMKQFGLKLLSNEKVLQSIKEKWNEVTNTKMNLEFILGFVDEQAKNIKESQRLNFIRWKILKKKVVLNPVVKCTFDGEVDFLKEYLETRFKLIGKILETADTTKISQDTSAQPGQGGWGGFPWGGFPWGGQGEQDECKEYPD